MLRRILKETAILIASLSLLPGVIAALLWYQGRPIDDLLAVINRLISGGVYPAPNLLDLGLKWAAPYLALMAVRALWWSRKGASGRMWASFYFSALSLLLAASIFTSVWDTFYLMCQLGDIPGELRQFIEIEGRNLALLAATTLLGLYCLGTAILISLKRGGSQSGAGGATGGDVRPRGRG